MNLLRRSILVLLLTFASAGCALGSVALLTAEAGPVGCYTSGVSGQLVADATYGTAIVQSYQTEAGVQEVSLPVKWPAGYTGRHSFGQVEVVDASGNAVARTGTRIQLLGGSEGSDPRIWVACGLGPTPPD